MSLENLQIWVTGTLHIQQLYVAAKIMLPAPSSRSVSATAYWMWNIQVFFCHISLSAAFPNVADDNVVCHYATGSSAVYPHDGDLKDGDFDYCSWTQELPWSYSSLRHMSIIFKSTSTHHLRLSRVRITVPSIENNQMNWSTFLFTNGERTAC